MKRKRKRKRKKENSEFESSVACYHLLMNISIIWFQAVVWICLKTIIFGALTAVKCKIQGTCYVVCETRIVVVGIVGDWGDVICCSVSI